MMSQSLTLCCLVLVACVYGNTVSTNDTACPTICPSIYKPVCGTDGQNFKEFASTCNLLSHNCRRERNSVQAYAATDAAWCSSEFVENLHEKLGNFKLEVKECFKPCSMIYQPVCVTNGKYRAELANSCLLENFNCALQVSGAQPAELFRLLREEKC
ncbi:enhancer of split M1 protein [Drosophila yakuba]|uniref:Enhancer of split M1 protein n=1 Tax=Drosophila yakuba TaxID=7245 RepID=B4PSY0_DROYA|nr:enhancer of split M1 protein [Drosophila yakuba]EDW98667.1 m1 [Drosophila yakuba]